VDPGGLKKTETGSLRSSVLDGLAVLLVLSLSGLAAVMLAWLPVFASPQVLFASLFMVIVADVALTLLYMDRRLRRLFLRPVEGMVAQAEAIAAGHYDRRLDPNGGEELERLAESVNDMADRLIHHQHQLRQNVASLHETNRALSIARHELVQSEKLAAIGRMSAGIAHEIGNPLGAVFGYLEVARRRGVVDREWIESVQEEVTRIDRVVRGLLDFARPTYRPAVIFEVNEVVSETIGLLQKQGRLQSVTVTTDLQRPSSRVRGDPGHLQQILVNLLLNADDAVQGGAGRKCIRVSAATREFRAPLRREPSHREGDRDGVDYSHLRRHRTEPDSFGRFEPGDRVVWIEVRDNGMGIGESALRNVFEPFFTTKEPGRGTGLGLAVSARLAESLGGGMAAESKPEEGTKFMLVLPTAGREGDTEVAEEVA